MKRTALVVLVLSLILPTSGAAKSVREPGVESFCATRVSTTAISYARHQFNRQRRQLEGRDRVAFGDAAVQIGPSITKQKNIAVVEDDGTINPPPNLFDLGGSIGIQFKGGPKTRAERFPGGISSARGQRIEIGDDASRTIDLPFPFNFYGTTYTRVFLNSDGNLTFNQAETSTAARSLGRFLEGPPRIAVDFLDLDPSVTSGDDGVFLLEQPGMVRVTWVDVPEFGLSNENTFQVTLYPTGRITMAFGDVDAGVGIVGVSPGGPGAVRLVDFSQAGVVQPTNDAIAEQFLEVSVFDDLAAARAVLSRVRDEYDVLVVFSDFENDLDDAFAYNAGVSNAIQGIGDAIFDISNLYGSNGKLKAFVQMGALSKYPGNPRNLIPGFAEATGQGVLAHEVGHVWLALPTFMRGGQRSTDLLGRQMAHWSFLKDSDGSVLEGNDIRDNGDGTFATIGSWIGFSALDEYLMGLRRPDEVPPFFYVGASELDPTMSPSTGVQITGERRNVTINQIIAAEGPRVPSAANAKKVTQVAFVLVGREGEPPSLASIRKVNQYRNRLSTFFREQTGGRGRMATWLRLRNANQVAPASVVKLPAATDEGAAVDGSDTDAAAAPDPDSVPDGLTRRFDRLEERTRR